MVGNDERREHWWKVYVSRAPEATSSYQREPTVSLALIAAIGLTHEAGIIDMGGGASALVDHLLDLGCTDLAVLDVAKESLAAARQRLGERANRVNWISADVTAWRPHRRWALWHDRAVFHFLVAAEDRHAHVTSLEAAQTPGDHFIVATFAPEGPERCSDLPVVRYDEARLGAELGTGFRFVESRRETHLMPRRTEQAFQYQHYVRA